MAAPYEQDLPFAPDELLFDAARAYGTPLLVYSEGLLRRRAKALRAAFSGASDFRNYFPIRVCNTPGVLSLLHEAGIGFLCGGAVELEAARRAGAAGEEILFAAAFPRDADLRTACEMGAALYLDSPSPLDCLEAAGLRPGRLILGAALRTEPRHIPALRGDFRFGMEPDDLILAAKRGAALGAKLGLQVYAGTSAGPGFLEKKARYLLRVKQEVESGSGTAIDLLDLSGSLPAVDRKGKLLKIGAEAAGVLNALREAGCPEFRLCTELGRLLAAPCALLLTRVQGIKQGRQCTVGLDASLADLPKLVFCGTPHHVSKLGSYSIENRRSYYLAGSSMEPLDQLGGRRVLPELRIGDLLVFHNTGAYTASVACSYGGSLRCAEALLREDGTVMLLRPRQRAESLL